MSWDDEDFDIPVSNKAPTSWEEEANDEPLLDSWDAEEEEPSKGAEKKTAKVSSNATSKAKPKKTDKKGTGSRAVLDIDKVDEKTRRELLRKAELESDLNNAADLFGGLGVAEDINEHPRERAQRQAKASEADSAPLLTKDTPIESHPLFQPSSKADFEKLRKSLAPALTNLSKDSLLNYSSGLAIDLIRDLTQPLSIENVRKVISTLNTILKEKERQERQARLSKAGGTATGGAGKKKAKPTMKTNVNSSFKKDIYDDMDDSKFDDFGDDDFM